MLRGELDITPAMSIAFNLSALCSKEVIRGWFGKKRTDLITADEIALRSLTRLTPRYNTYLLIDDPEVHHSTVQEWIDENYIPVTKAWTIPDSDHYNLFMHSIYVECVLVVHPSIDNFFSRSSRGEVLHYMDVTSGWCALLDYLESRAL